MKRSKADIFTPIDNFIFCNFTKKMPNVTSKTKRNIYICIANPKLCDKIFHYRTERELYRLFNHLCQEHSTILFDTLLNHLMKNPNLIETSSNCKEISDYIQTNIFPKILTNEKKIEISNEQSFTTPKESNNLIDLKQVDLTNLKQIILEKGIYDRVPFCKICSKKYSSIFGEFVKLGYEIATNTNINKNELLKIINNMKISRSLLDKVGHDYFNASISYFIGSNAAFQIDAGRVNKKKMLVFMLSAKQRTSSQYLFDIDMDFEPTLKGYKKSVMERINKAKSNNINIVGIVSDNLPVQIKAVSHESFLSIQHDNLEAQGIVHFRCCNHLLNLAYKDWLKNNNELTEYETRIHKISLILNNEKFYKYLKKKIPIPNVTRWNSTFKSFEKIIQIFNSILSLYKNNPKEITKELTEIRDDVKYLITIGIPKVYPLLFYFEKLTDQIQQEDVSCVEAVLIIEHYLKKIKQMIFKYKIDSGKELIHSIKRRLLLKKNVQLYQLASLFTPDGIVRYRKKMKKYSEYNIKEDSNKYFRTLKNQVIIDHIQDTEFLINENYEKIQCPCYIQILDQFNPFVKKRKFKTKQKKK